MYTSLEETASALSEEEDKLKVSWTALEADDLQLDQVVHSFHSIGKISQLIIPE